MTTFVATAQDIDTAAQECVRRLWRRSQLLRLKRQSDRLLDALEQCNLDERRTVPQELRSRLIALHRSVGGTELTPFHKAVRDTQTALDGVFALQRAIFGSLHPNWLEELAEDSEDVPDDGTAERTAAFQARSLERMRSEPGVLESQLLDGITAGVERERLRGVLHDMRAQGLCRIVSSQQGQGRGRRARRYSLVEGQE